MGGGGDGGSFCDEKLLLGLVDLSLNPFNIMFGSYFIQLCYLLLHL